MKKLMGTLTIAIGMVIMTLGIGDVSHAAANSHSLNGKDAANLSVVDTKDGTLSHIVQEVGETDDNHTIMEYTIQNIGIDDVTLTYGTSMKYDYSILNEYGKVIYRDSDEKMYMQILGQIEIVGGDHESFTFELPELSAGEYTLLLTPAAKGYSDEQAVEHFKVK